MGRELNDEMAAGCLSDNCGEIKKEALIVGRRGNRKLIEIKKRIAGSGSTK